MMGTEAAEETSMAVKTLHRALISPNETSSGFFSNHDVISPHEEVSSEPKAWNVSDISPLSYPVLGMAEPWEQGVAPSNFGRSVQPILKCGSRLCPLHYYLPQPNFRTFCQPLILVEKGFLELSDRI